MTATAAAADPRSIVRLKLKTLKESPTNPRKTFARMTELASSIKAQGVLSPLIVREVGDDKYEIVAGHRRFRAAKEAGLDEVPCEIVKLDDRAAMEVQLTENLQRVDLNDVEEAELMDALQQTGIDAPEIAKRMGVSVGTVYARLKLLALCAEARKALAEGTLPGSVAVPLARIPSHQLQAKALKSIKERFVVEAVDGSERGVIQARPAIEYLQKDFCRALRSAPFDLKDSMLVTEAGPCTTCPKNSRCATPGLFDDFKREKGQAFCTDVACFNEKVTTHWGLTAAAAEARGAKVLSADEGAKLFPFGTLQHGSKYVELDTPNHADKSKRTWRDFFDRLPAEKRPQLIVVPDRDYKPREVVDADKLREALAEAPGAPKWAKEELTRAEKIAEAKAEVKETRVETERRERVIVEAMRKIGDKLPAALSDEVLRFILIGLADRWIPQPVLDACTIPNRDVYEKEVGKASGKALRSMLLMWGAFSGDILEAGEGYPAAFKALAKQADVDVKAIEKALDAGDAAEELMKPAKKKPAKEAKA